MKTTLKNITAFTLFVAGIFLVGTSVEAEKRGSGGDFVDSATETAGESTGGLENNPANPAVLELGAANTSSNNASDNDNTNTPSSESSSAPTGVPSGGAGTGSSGVLDDAFDPLAEGLAGDMPPTSVPAPSSEQE
jgi:hypothetical protein